MNMLTQDHNAQDHNSQGIEELIEQLKNKGVAAGKEESVRIIADAEKRAEWILSQATEEAENLIASARRDAEFIQQAGKEALQVSYRDVVLRLKDELSGQFAAQLEKLIQHEMQSTDTLKLLLFAATSQHPVPDQDMDLQISHESLQQAKDSLPSEALGLEELRNHPESLKSGMLLELLSEVARAMLNAKVEVKIGNRSQPGIVFVMHENNIEIELTDEALSQALLNHLQPRFRAILEGVVA